MHISNLACACVCVCVYTIYVHDNSAISFHNTFYNIMQLWNAVNIALLCYTRITCHAHEHCMERLNMYTCNVTLVRVCVCAYVCVYVL